MVLPVKQAYLCNLREQRSGDVEVNGCEVALKPLGHCKFATVYIEAEPSRRCCKSAAKA